VTLLLHDDRAARYQEWLMGPGRALAIVGMLVAWQLFGYVFRPVFLIAVNLLHPGMNYGG